MRLTDKDYNIISKKAYSLDPKEYKAEEHIVWERNLTLTVEIPSH